MNLLSGHDVYQKSYSQVSGRGGLRTELPLLGVGALAERDSHSYLSPKIYNFSAEGLKCQTAWLIVSVKTSGLSGPLSLLCMYSYIVSALET